MQISCPQCATVYDLDERVLPPGGAPVQCTRCSHVFTASPEAQSATGGTKIFGMPKFDGAQAPDDAPEPSREPTRVYGGPVPKDPPQPQPPPQARAPATTQGFGTPSPPASPPSSRSTQIFGAAARTPPSPAQPDVRSTQIFGVPAAPAQPDLRSTQLFGAAPAAPAAPSPGPDPMRSTQIFGAAPQGKDPLRSTQIFGAPTPPSRTPVPPREPERATPRLGMPAVLPTQDAPERPVDPLRQTQIFGKPQVAITPQTLQLPSFRPPDAPGTDEPDFAAPPAAPQAPQARATPMFGTPAHAPLPPFAPFDAAEPKVVVSEQLEDDPGKALQRGRRRRTFATLAVLALVALGVGGYAVFQALSSRRTPPPEEAIAAHSEALRALRRDDPRSLALAVSQLEDVTAKWPDYAEARVTHLVALLFGLEDLKIRIDRVTGEANRLTVEIAKLKERQAPADWENRVNALVDEVTALKAEGDPLVEAATAQDARVNEARRNLQAGPQPLHPEEEVQLVRAQALYAGVKGSDQALVLSERFRALGGTDGWGDVAFAEYALNARVAPETRRQARKALEELRATDSAWTRLYVMVGRLALRDNEVDLAVTSLESALTLNPGHQTAKLLLEQARKKRAELSAQEAQ